MVGFSGISGIAQVEDNVMLRGRLLDGKALQVY